MLEKEFSFMIESHIWSLTKNALKFTKNLEDANDLVQETLVKAIRFYKKYEKGTNLTGWLFVIMKNTFLNKCKKEARKRVLIVQDEKISSVNLLHSADLNKSSGAMIVEDVRKALGTIPVAYRISFVRYVDGYKYQEIAEQLNIPLGTVKTRIHEASLLLKKKLKVYAVG